MTGGLLSAADETIEGIASFGHSAGTNFTTSLAVGYSALGFTATYNLSGSGLLMATNESIGDYFGSGNFTQAGGTNSVGSPCSVKVPVSRRGSTISTGAC